jgi:hypothetical protein
MVQEKIKDFSFELKPDWRDSYYPEYSDVQNIVDKTMESYRLLQIAGQFKEASQMKEKIKETKYAKMHLMLVMNLDFSKPTEKMREMARKNNIDCDNPQVLEEFKRI